LDFSSNQISDWRWARTKGDFKMANLKLKNCGCLHEAWIKVKAMKTTIIKRWDETSITTAFFTYISASNYGSQQCNIILQGNNSCSTCVIIVLDIVDAIDSIVIVEDFAFLWEINAHLELGRLQNLKINNVWKRVPHGGKHFANFGKCSIWCF
jgi:hypothetical protein